MVAVYPKSIADLINDLQYSGSVEHRNGVGSEARFDCGCFIKFEIQVAEEPAIVEDIKYRTNGCGYMAAVAETVAGSVAGRCLKELKGTFDAAINVSDDREKCLSTTLGAVRAAFADHRSRLVEEFRGEKALVCTCFGVTEEKIESYVRNDQPMSLDQMIDDLRAGSGCGSCRMLLRDFLDSA
ncbi:MAG TPA: (2Fe-2S)-binding protein [Pyrinomonadaceae bacterium]